MPTHSRARGTRALTTERVWTIAYEIAASKAKAVSATYNLEELEAESLLDRYHDLIATKIVPGWTFETEEDLRKGLNAYFGLRSKDGRRSSAGWQAIGIRARRGRAVPLVHRGAEGTWQETEVEDISFEPFEVLAARETFSERVAEALAEREKAIVARRVLDAYLEGAPEIQRLILGGLADGLNLREIADLGGSATEAEWARLRQARRRMWKGLPEHVRHALEVLGLQVAADPRKGRRGTTIS